MSIEMLSQKLGLKTTIEKKKGGKQSTTKSKIVKYLNSEIELLEERGNLNLLRVPKTSSSKITKKNPTGEFYVNEMRSWRQSNDDKTKCLIMIRLSNKIYGFGKEHDPKNPTYLQCDYDYNTVLEYLKNLKDGIDSMTDSEVDNIGKKETETVETVS